MPSEGLCLVVAAWGRGGNGLGVVSVASGGERSELEPDLESHVLQDVNGPARELRPRLCHLVKGPQGYGFNLHSDKSRPGQYIRSVDPGSPAAHSGLRAQDRLIEVPITEASVCQVPCVRCPLCAYLCLSPHLHACACVPCLCLGPRSSLGGGECLGT